MGSKLFSKIGIALTGIAMAIGVGVGLRQKEFKEVNADPDLTTYTAALTTKPTGDSNALGVTSPNNAITWAITDTTNYNGYQSAYSGIQVGASKKDGAVTFTTNASWGSVQAATSYYGYTKVHYVYLWLNAGSAVPTASVSIGGIAATSDGADVEKNSSANGDYTKTTKVTFTPAAGHDTGAISFTISTTYGAGYICAVQVVAEKPAASPSEPTITITNASISGKVGDTVNLTCTYTNTTSFVNDPTVVWSVPDNSIATIDGSTLTFVKNGENVAVTATLKDGDTTKATTTKATDLLVPTVTITGSGVADNKLNMFALSSVTLGETHTNQPTNNYSYIWSHSGTAGTFNAETKEYTAGQESGADTITVQMKYNQTVIASNTITINVSFDNSKGVYRKCTDVSELTNGTHITIMNSDNDVVMSEISSKNIRGTSASLHATKNYIECNNSIYDIEIEKSGDDFKFKVGADSYLYAASSSDNQLKAAAWNTAKTNDNGLWTISINGGVATITSKATSNRPCMAENDNNGSPIFSCYATDKVGGYNTLSIFIYKSFEKEADEFADYFLEQTDGYCEESLSASVKNNIISKFNGLTDIAEKGAKQLFISATIVRGKNQTYENDISEALSRYVNMVEEGRETNFLGLSDAVLNRAVISGVPNITKESNNTLIAIIIIASVSALAVGGYFFIRRKHQ